jgi:hypothetical protein
VEVGAQRIHLSPRPSCPEHPEAKVRLDGTYGSGGHKRQRYKCVLPNGATHVEHIFQSHEGP